MITFMTRGPQAPHEDEEGALSPRRETLALLQGVPKGVTHRAIGTTHEQHVPSFTSDEILKIGGGKEEEWHHKKKSMNPSPFQKIAYLSSEFMRDSLRRAGFSQGSFLSQVCKCCP